VKMRAGTCWHVLAFWGKPTQSDFESGAFNHSATLPLESPRTNMRDSLSPASRIGYAGLPNLILTQLLMRRNPVKPSGHVPNFSRIEVKAICIYSVNVFGSAFCLAQSPLTAPFCFIESAARRRQECTEAGEPRNTEKKGHSQAAMSSLWYPMIPTFLGLHIRCHSDCEMGGVTLYSPR
jgi:hypothetical protein